MSVPCLMPGLEVARDIFQTSFDREPFEFTHNLNDLDIFEPNALRRLANKYIGKSRDTYVAGGAPTPGTTFYSVPKPKLNPYEALDRLDSGGIRVLLKRPENYDARFRELLDSLFRQIIDLRGGLGAERVVRLESAVLITSAATITPFHFDPEINFFSQITGEKTYHVHAPATLSEAELERFYIHGAIDIAQVNLQGRNPEHAHTFALRPGKGLHQPQNAPHWVETNDSRSVSYAFVFETNTSRARGRVRAFNYYLRKLWINPSPPGRNRRLDGLKSFIMRGGILARKAIVKVLENLPTTRNGAGQSPLATSA